MCLCIFLSLYSVLFCEHGDLSRPLVTNRRQVHKKEPGRVHKKEPGQTTPTPCKTTKTHVHKNEHGKTSHSHQGVYPTRKSTAFAARKTVILGWLS